MTLFDFIIFVEKVSRLSCSTLFKAFRVRQFTNILCKIWYKNLFSWCLDGFSLLSTTHQQQARLRSKLLQRKRWMWTQLRISCLATDFFLFSDRDALRSNFVTKIHEYFKRQLFIWAVKDVDEIHRCAKNKS